VSLAESLAHAVGIGQINERARLVHGDCLDPVTGLASLPDQSVDHVITDPPYEIEAHTKDRRTRGQSIGGGERTITEAPLEFPPITEAQRDGAAAHLARVARRWVMVFCQAEAVAAWRDALVGAGLVYKRACVWVKPDAQPQLTGDRPGVGYESIVLAHVPGRSRWNGGGRPGIYRFNKYEGSGARNVHQTQKPIALMRALVEDFTDANDLILDPFAGSGTTGVAALTLGRRFVGWEMDAKHHATAARRIGETREQPSLLGPRGPKAKQQGFGL
jgi:site-specific DNA-methyltransferase (adenine-specific)